LPNQLRVCHKEGSDSTPYDLFQIWIESQKFQYNPLFPGRHSYVNIINFQGLEINNYFQHGNFWRNFSISVYVGDPKWRLTSWFAHMVALITHEHDTCLIKLENECWTLHAAICITFNLMLLTVILWWLQHCHVPIWHVRKKPFVQEVCTTYTSNHFLLCILALVFYLLT